MPSQPIEKIVIALEDLFSLDELQRIQDEFAAATGVASIITHLDGTPITAPSNFTHLCSEIIRKTETGCLNCYKSDAAIGRYHPDGPIVQPCLSGGLWDAGVSINVGGRHIANWLIGQVRNETQNEENMRAYASEIGTNEEAFMEAYQAVPSMSRKKFGSIAQVLFTIVNQLSSAAYQNVQQARFIAERRQVEEALRESEERYRSILNACPDDITIANLEGQILMVSPVGMTMFGYNQEDSIQGRLLLDFIVPEDRDRALSNIAKMFQGGQRGANEYRGLRSDGSTFDIEVNNEFIRNAEGQPLSMVLVIRDITERKRSEEALRESEERFRALHNASFGGIVIHDQGIILDFNQGLSGITGYTLEELIGMDGLNLIALEWRELVMQNIRRGFDQGYEVEGRRKDGTQYPLSIRGTTIPYKGRSVRVTEFRDITERKRAEEETAKLGDQLQQAQKMESVGQLAGGVAHDFNNMLGVILGHAELAMNQIDRPKELFTHLEEIRKAATRSADITRQLLAFARKQTIVPKELLLNETVEGMLKMLRRLIGEDINLEWSPGVGLWPVKMDPSQIDQILANLCVNARDAIAGVGKISVETGNSTFDEEYCIVHNGFVPGQYVRITVSDNGHGMDKETLSHIFEPFYTTKGVGEGTGLGLATVYGAIRQNNGFINAYSEPGQGSIFTIYLPRHVATAGLAQAEEVLEPALRGHETILLVEDEPTILNMTTMMLQHLGYTVLAASTPDEATFLAGELGDKIHLLLTDVIMPQMNGRDLAQRLLECQPGMKHLFMSGYTANIIARQGVLDEGVCFIQKPFSKKELADKVREALESEKSKGS